MKLISMINFVLEQALRSDKQCTCMEQLNYANFLKQLLELWMFVPCWKNKGIWVPLDEVPKLDSNNEEYLAEYNEYKKAKDRVLFEGFKIDRIIEKENTCYSLSCGEINITIHQGLYNFNGKGGFATTIGDIVCQSPELTKTAQKQIGL